MQSTFYSLKWESAPPEGMLFNPKSATLEWIPTIDNIWFC
jgi:hypothetical protein